MSKPPLEEAQPDFYGRLLLVLLFLVFLLPFKRFFKVTHLFRVGSTSWHEVYSALSPGA